jgi:hypothetical protein
MSPIVKVSLAPKDHERLLDKANEAMLPPSTLARLLILRALTDAAPAPQAVTSVAKSDNKPVREIVRHVRLRVDEPFRPPPTECSACGATVDEFGDPLLIYPNGVRQSDPPATWSCYACRATGRF